MPIRSSGSAFLSEVDKRDFEWYNDKQYYYAMKEKTMNSNICNHCGGEYGYRNGRYICFSCGSYKPEAISNEEVTLLYTAFQKLRLADFDEAEQEFDDILQKYPENSNAYWGRLMSRYGIKYEKDFDGKMIPTCYATSIESVTDDKDYQQALHYADGESKIYYRQQAEYIERVRLEWVEKAKKEKPYDIFISYKDSDLAHGIERTKDSFAAQEIYIHLLEQGYRVFFSRESLRDKTGEKYEPYIFNALSTAKIMLVYGSSAEYIKSTWLKNEWHRFAKKIADGEKHPEALLVACEGFSPSELPHVLSSRQCFDASRRTFFGDLDKCIERIMETSYKDTSVPKKEKTVISGLHEHSYKKTVVKSTCVAMGYTLHQCECGEEYRDTYTPLAEHRYKVINRIDPACKKAGKVEEICEVCGQKQSKEIPALGHDFSKWTETKRPTCTENGEEQRQCQRCGEVEKKVLEKTGHSFGDWVKNPDGTSTGYCKKCGATKTKVLKEKCLTEETSEEKTEKRFYRVFFPLISIIIIGCIIGFAWLSTSASDFKFKKLSDGTYEISSVKAIPSDGRLIIPSTYKDVPVTVIGDGFIGKSNRLLTSVVIPDSVTVIGKGAFRDCESLTNVDFPESIVVIGENAFYNCKNLTDVIIPDSVTTIEKNAFCLCESLQNLIIGNRVITIGESAFAHTRFLTSVTIPEGVKVIGDWAFEGCRNLSEVVLGTGVTTIGRYAFDTCDRLTDIIIPNSVTTIGDGAFRACSGLTRIEIPDSVTEFGECPFMVCTQLTEIIVSQTNPNYISVDGNLYSKDQKVLIQYAAGKMDSSFVIPNGVTKIGDAAFLSCCNLTHVVIPNGVTEIDDHAFQFCNLPSIKIPDGVSRIGQNAFYGCDFSNVTIPASVMEIGYGVFDSCENLKTIYFEGSEDLWNNITGKKYIPSGVKVIFNEE